jgi:hypothetical protein
MQHPNKEKLENYAARRLSADEMTLVILHLENCADCFEIIKTFPQSTEDQSLALFYEIEKDFFHLDYDEHLRPFIDKEADGATREIVESHTQSCSDCAFELRELREFAESLRLREIEENPNPSPEFLRGFGERLRGLFRRRSFQIAFSFSVVLLFGLAAFVWLSNKNPAQKASQPGDNPREGQSLPFQPNSNENDQTVAGSENKNVSNGFPGNQNSTDLTKSQIPENRRDSPGTGDRSAELNSLPETARGTVQSAVQSEKITFPAFLSVIGGNLKLRGETNGKPIFMFPSGEAIRQVSPRFYWQSFAKPDEKYIVEIFDEQNNSVETSPSLKAANWTPKTALLRGRIYKWEVRAERTDGSPKTFAGKFMILDQKAIDDLSNISTTSSFARGILLASKGLLNEAEKEFRQAVKEDDRAALAKKFLRQIEKQR